MIKIRLVAVGKVKEEYYRKAVDEYAKRLGAFCKFEIVELKEENFKSAEGATDKILSAEGERIKDALRGYSIAFAVEGKELSSEKLAEKIKNLIDAGVGEMTFVIGGSYGIKQEVKLLCKEKISFSQMTFPHTLTRVIACEQIYRAFTIISGKEYHK